MDEKGNEFTRFINSRILLCGTLICIIGFSIAAFAITILEKTKKEGQQTDPNL